MNDLQLEKYRHDLAYLKAMAAQTIKDFDRFNYTLVFNEGLPVQFNNYCIQLAEQLQFWCKFDADRIPGLLYHIDIPESDFKKTLFFLSCSTYHARSK